MDNNAAAQTETFDIATFTPPGGWEKETRAGVVIYTVIRETNYCVIMVYASAATSGLAKQDFAVQWHELVVEPFGASETPENVRTHHDEDGWEVIIGTSTVEIKAASKIVVLTTYSGFGRLFCILILMNSDFFQDELSTFLNGVTLKKTELPQTLAVNSGSFSDVSFAVPEGWAQQNYSDGITLQSPMLNCGNDTSFVITILNSRPFNGDLRRQANDIAKELYGTEGNMIWSTLPSGLDYMITNVTVSSPKHFEADLLSVKCGNDLFLITHLR